MPEDESRVHITPAATDDGQMPDPMDGVSIALFVSFLAYRS